MKISALISWPDSFDFPLFRDRLPILRKHVHEIIICFTKHGNHSLREWLKANIKDVIFLDAEESKYSGDWRNKSTNLMIDKATGDWFLSLEQDFFINDYDNFFKIIKTVGMKYEVIGFEEEPRIHPACLFFKRGVYKEEKRDFSVMGSGIDHFAYFTKHLRGETKWVIYFEDISLYPGRDWLHLRGLTDNYFAPVPYAGLDEFGIYNDACKKIECSEYWKSEMERCTLPHAGKGAMLNFI